MAIKNTYIYAFIFGFIDRLLWGDGFGYSLIHGCKVSVEGFNLISEAAK